MPSSSHENADTEASCVDFPAIDEFSGTEVRPSLNSDGPVTQSYESKLWPHERSFPVRNYDPETFIKSPQSVLCSQEKMTSCRRKKLGCPKTCVPVQEYLGIQQIIDIQRNCKPVQK